MSGLLHAQKAASASRNDGQLPTIGVGRENAATRRAEGLASIPQRIARSGVVVIKVYGMPGEAS